jgi:hypothetical protein
LVLGGDEPMAQRKVTKRVGASPPQYVNRDREE